MQLNSEVRQDVEKATIEQSRMEVEGKVPPYPEFVRKLFKPMGSTVLDLLHGAVGLSGEAGEVLDLIKKSWVYNKPLDEAKLIEELGDARYYYISLLNMLGITDAQVEAYNKRKLLRRFPNGYTDQAAQQRVDVEQASNVVNMKLPNAPEKPFVDIEDWYIVGKCLFGMAQNHPRGSGKPDFIRSSRIVLHDPSAKTVETLNTIYRLGTPHPPESVY